MAAVSSHTACAAVTSHTKGTAANKKQYFIKHDVNVIKFPIANKVPSEPRQSFVNKIHGITDKLQSLSYSMSHGGGSDSVNGSCSDQKSKSGE